MAKFISLLDTKLKLCPLLTHSLGASSVPYKLNHTNTIKIMLDIKETNLKNDR